MCKNGRGTMNEFTLKDAGLVICAWFDDRRVLTISNYVGKEPVSNANCYDRKNQKEILVPRPASVEIYNRYMGELTKEMLLPLYCSKLRSRKWYYRFAIH